ncbi:MULTISPECIES: porin [unclassified Burkholderia]|uniref:porin n=1 Tax=unclassified Burkholderia TaxID=2613784 RepID=UPI000F56029E|nr:MULTISPECIES: porin [unclassified Burkholderia]RQR69845.1 porin [Burkholderia sp. Bp9012]RQR73338.1 porin [Burkholderia sp. Bp9011]RQR85197.1 porin [Burkholderia sp. Bp9010]RQZ40321.1 porin [Burkholderia sp. Bp9099]
MKKNLLAVTAVLSVISIPSHAQSSVTLYGIVDAGIAFNSNSGGSRLYQLSSGNMQGSRWGLRGAEDLGAGLKAVFAIENGYNVTNGKLLQGGDEFGRQAYVGLASDRFGSVTLGRQYDVVVDFAARFESAAQWATGYGAHPGDLDNLQNSNRVNNAIKFKSVDYAGLKFGGVYSLGGVAGHSGTNQIWSVGAGYDRGPLSLGVGYLNARDPNYSFFGNNSTSSTTASNMTASTVYSGYASARTQQIIAAGAAYQLGHATIGAMYTNTQFRGLGALSSLNSLHYQGTAAFHNAEMNFKYLLTPALTVGASYDYMKGYGVNHATYHQVNLGVDYFLSPRTDVYISGIYQHATGTDSTGKTAVANITGFSASSNGNQFVAVTGIRHKF